MSKWWTRLKAAERFLGAIAAGDVAPEAEQAARAAVCAGCPALVVYEESLLLGLVPAYSGFCGEESAPSDTGPDGGGPTCGCFVLAQAEAKAGEARAELTVKGRAMEAGPKLMIASEACPRGRWQSVKSAKQQSSK